MNKEEFYIGLDIGSSSVKAALVEVQSGKNDCLIQEPQNEMHIHSSEKGWAEQDPELWWKHTCSAIRQLLKKSKRKPAQIKGIGLAYQMHGLVVIDKKGNLLRDSIIWCDSRAVKIGERAFNELGNSYCNEHLLNSPANFTASKLKWVKNNEPEIFEKIYKMMLPGDYISYRLSGKINTTISGLSEGILWDFKENTIAYKLLDHYEIPYSFIPEIIDTFSKQAVISEKGSEESGLLAGTPVLYRAGDQPNNALSLNVLKPGEIAATGGTSGVVYAITDQSSTKENTRINNFAHVNYDLTFPSIGKLLNINGAGIQLRWLKENLEISSYDEMNQLASQVEPGADGLRVIPFGNGAERVFKNKIIGSHFINLDLNRHTKAHLCRATLEGIAFAFAYGINILKSDLTAVKTLKVGNDNLFQSEIFSTTIANLINGNIELYNTTGAIGAARACALFCNDFETFGKLISKNDHLKTYTPEENNANYLKIYKEWEELLTNILKWQ